MAPVTRCRHFRWPRIRARGPLLADCTRSSRGEQRAILEGVRSTRACEPLPRGHPFFQSHPQPAGAYPNTPPSAASAEPAYLLLRPITELGSVSKAGNPFVPPQRRPGAVAARPVPAGFISKILASAACCPCYAGASRAASFSHAGITTAAAAEPPSAGGQTAKPATPVRNPYAPGRRK